MSATFVALLRGINVGGKNKLPMKELAALFEEAGAGAVQTYIQSGNVVYAGAARAGEKIAATVEKRIGERFSLRVPVVVRTREAIEGAARGNPFLARGADPSMLHVMFLAGAPSARAVSALDPGRSPGDEFQVIGREVFCTCPTASPAPSSPTTGSIVSSRRRARSATGARC